MASTPQRFEGPDLEALLDRVRHELGADATIVSANKVRTGGIAGFFAKEHYEVLASPADGGPAGSVRPPAQPVIPEDRVPPSAAPAGVSAADEEPAPPATGQPATLLDLAERVSAAERAGEGFVPMMPAEMPRLATESESFADVLTRIAAEAGPEAAEHVAERLHLSAPAVDEAVEADVAGDLAEDEEDDPCRGLRAVGPSLHARVTTDLPAPTVPAAPGGSSSPGHAIDHVADRGMGVPPPAPAAYGGSPSPGDAIDHVADRSAAGATVAAPVVPPLPPPSPEPVVRTSSDLERLVTTVRDAGLHRGALVRALDALPEPPAPPRHPGAILAVVGDPAQALPTARRLAGEIDTDPGRVVLVAEPHVRGLVPADRRLRTLAEVEERQRAWRRRRRPTVVVVDAPVGPRSGNGWVRDVMDTLEAGLVWGVVDATRKTDDLAVWTERIGGVDALAVVAVDETTSPQSVLELGVPVALLDDEPATPERWADVLLEQVPA